MTVVADPLRARGSTVAMLSDTLRRGGSALESVPVQVKELLQSGGWQHFVTKLGKEVHHERFVDFLTTPPLAGLGASVDTVHKLLADDNEAASLFDAALQNPSGLHNVKAKAPTGNRKDQALRRLRKDAPNLHADVIAGRLSAHAAMVRAGFRPRTNTVQVDSAESAARSLRSHMKPDEIAALARLLLEG